MRGQKRLLTVALGAMLLALPGPAAAGAEDTFTKDVAPIFAARESPLSRVVGTTPLKRGRGAGATTRE